MTILRLNSFFFDFRNAPIPSELGCHRWLRTLGVNNGEAETIGYSNYRNRVTLKLKDSETFQRLLESVSDKNIVYKMEEGDEFPIPFLQW